MVFAVEFAVSLIPIAVGLCFRSGPAPKSERPGTSVTTKVTRLYIEETLPMEAIIKFLARPHALFQCGSPKSSILFSMHALNSGHPAFPTGHRCLRNGYTRHQQDKNNAHVSSNFPHATASVDDQATCQTVAKPSPMARVRMVMLAGVQIEG